MLEELKTKQQRLPKFRRAPELYGPFRFSETDLEILRLIHDYRYVSADLVFALVQGNRRHLADRLQGMFHHAYVQRLLPPPAMRIADGPQKGSEKFTYVLDEFGATTLARAEGIGVRELAWDPRHVNRMNWFVEHQLMVGTFRAAVELGVRTRDDLSFVEWRGEEEIRDVVGVRYPDGTKREHRVAPDAYFAVRERGKVRHFFLEADRGSEEHARILPKFRALWWYCAPQSPFYTKYEDAKDVLILFVCESENRLAAMRQTLAKVDERQRGLRRFWFTTSRRYSLMKPEALVDEPIWNVGPLSCTEDRRGLFEKKTLRPKSEG